MPTPRLIPTEATPLGTPAGTPEPESSTASASRKARAVVVNNGFLALPVLVSSSVSGLQETTQWVYVRRKEDDDRTVFAVNVPYGSNDASIAAGIEAILKARNTARKGKGKAVVADALSEAECSVEKVEVVASTSSGSRHSQSLLEAEGIHHPSSLLKAAAAAEAGDSGKKKNKKKRKADAAAESESAGPSIHPLFISEDLTTEAALSHLFPSSNTLKAHITLSSSKAAALLVHPGLGSMALSQWPSPGKADGEDAELSFISLGGGGRSNGRKTGSGPTLNEQLYDLARPSLSSLKLHADEWMAHFDATHRKLTASTSASVPAAPKSKRAEKREAAAKAVALAELEKAKAIKKRRVYDDDFLAPEVDEEGWTTVAKGGRYGRSALDGGEEGEAGAVIVEDQEEVNAAIREGYASGKRSVGIASKDFVRREQEAQKLERARELALLNAKMGIVASTGQSDETLLKTSEALRKEMVESRGSGRGKKKRGTKGIEQAMYGHQKREEARKGVSQLRQRFEQDKQRIDEMKRQKRFRPY